MMVEPFTKEELAGKYCAHCGIELASAAPGHTRVCIGCGGGSAVLSGSHRPRRCAVLSYGPLCAFDDAVVDDYDDFEDDFDDEDDDQYYDDEDDDDF